MCLVSDPDLKCGFHSPFVVVDDVPSRDCHSRGGFCVAFYFLYGDSTEHNLMCNRYRCVHCARCIFLQILVSFFFLILHSDVTNTQIVTLTVNVDIPVTNQVILYGSSCRTIPSDTPYTPPPSPDSPPSTTPTTTTTTTPSTTSTTSTPTPTTSYSTITTSSLVTTDGTTYVTLYTSTTATVPVSLSPSSSLVTSDGRTFTTFYFPSTSTSPFAALTTDPFQTMQASPPPTSNNTGAIVGGTLGGIAALALLALLTWHLMSVVLDLHLLFHIGSSYPLH